MTPLPRYTRYEDLRAAFIAAAHAAGATLHQYQHPKTGLHGEDLHTDVAIVAQEPVKKWVVLVSGTHGVEGYQGSTCQAQYLQRLQQHPLPDGVGLMMIHLINPWGTSWLRRVNENNIDLNRNYLDFSKPLPENPLYEKIHHLFGDSATTEVARAGAQAEWDRLERQLGPVALESKLEAGQYRHADGLYYGGAAPSWSNRTLHAILQRFLEDSTDVIAIDFHTGAGPYGHPMLMAIAEHEYPGMAAAAELYGGWLYRIVTRPEQTTDSGVSAEATGYTSQAVIDLLRTKNIIQLVIECGTYDNATRGRQALMDDHFLHLSGALSGAHFDAVKQELLEFFYPDDADWRELTWTRTRQILDRAISHLAQPGNSPRNTHKAGSH